MVGIAAMAGASLLAIAFLSRFFVAICKERQSISICMLLRLDREGGFKPVAARSSATMIQEVAEPLMGTSRIIAVLPTRKAQDWSQAG